MVIAILTIATYISIQTLPEITTCIRGQISCLVLMRSPILNIQEHSRVVSCCFQSMAIMLLVHELLSSTGKNMGWHLAIISITESTYVMFDLAVWWLRSTRPSPTFRLGCSKVAKNRAGDSLGMRIIRTPVRLIGGICIIHCYWSERMILCSTGFVWHLVLMILTQLLTLYSGSCTPSHSPCMVCVPALIIVR